MTAINNPALRLQRRPDLEARIRRNRLRHRFFGSAMQVAKQSRRFAGR